MPSLIILGLNLAVLVAMEIPARCFEMKPTHSAIERSIAWRTYAFLLLNMIVMPVNYVTVATSPSEPERCLDRSSLCAPVALPVPIPGRLAD